MEFVHLDPKIERLAIIKERERIENALASYAIISEVENPYFEYFERDDGKSIIRSNN